MRKEKKRREKKRREKGRRVFCEYPTSVVSPPNFRESFINLSSTFADDSEHPRS